MCALVFRTFPNRRFFDGKLLPEEYVDDHGFLSAKGVAVTRGIRELLDIPVALVMAPPWYGKTFVAEGLYRFLSAGPEDERAELPFGNYVWHTSFHQFGQHCSVEPSWWHDWQKADTGRACWIVDAIDEDWHTGNRAIFAMLERIEQLTPETRIQLSLILFCRKNEVPDEVRKKLEGVCSPNAQVATLALAPPDDDEALRIAGNPQKLDVVKRLIARNSLRSVGGYPTVIEQLAKRNPDEQITRKALWRDVVQTRLRSGRRERHDGHTLPEISVRFAAAKRAAAVTLFGGLRELDVNLRRTPS